MADTPEPKPYFDSFFDPIRNFFPWLERVIKLFRFPLLTAVGLFLLPFLGLFTDFKSLLASLFVSDELGIFLVSTTAFIAAWTILVTWRVISLYAGERFDPTHEVIAFSGKEQGQSLVFSITLWQAFLAALTAVPVTVAIICKTAQESLEIGWMRAVLFAVLGLLSSLALLFLGVTLQLLVNTESRVRQLVRSIFIVRWLPLSIVDWITRNDFLQTPRRELRRRLKAILGAGFFNEREGLFHSGPGFAASMILSIAIFIIAGQLLPYQLPALFFVILLLIVFCWWLCGLWYLFGRYRIPVLSFVLIFVYMSEPNYYYKVHSGKHLIPLTPTEVISGGSLSHNRIIVVATEGGGIQAAAWTARVLTGLQYINVEFGKAVRVISSVSGGSTGALFFVNGYNHEVGVPDAEALELIVDMAAENSLDDVARSLIYHDIIDSILRFWKLGDDRGMALERSWMKNCQKVCGEFETRSGKTCPVDCSMTGTLGEWSELVKEGRMPANIFNATIVETGDRLLISNSDVKNRKERGRLNIGELLGGKDIYAVTSARLSATFPYVSPAARAEIDEPIGAQRHVVDGGYYDNYGMTSLVEWLDNAFATNLLTDVLVIEIQSFDDGPKASEEVKPVKEEKKPNSEYHSQYLTPIYAMLKIRTSAQASHKNLEFALLRDKWPQRIQNAVFKFRCGDAPLTWKLTETEKRRIRDCWELKYANSNDPGSPTLTVKRFLEVMKSSSGQP